MNWHRFETPIPIKNYDLTPGVQIEVEYTDGLVSNPQKVRETYLIGEVNERGGLCDDCALQHETDCVVLAERVLVDPGLLE